MNDTPINKLEKLAYAILRHFSHAFVDEPEQIDLPKIDIYNEGFNDVMTASIVALHILFGQFSVQIADTDLIGFVGIQNRLVLQHLLEFGEIEPESEATQE